MPCVIQPSGDISGHTDTARINAALTMLPPNGGTITLDAGEFYVQCGNITINQSGVYLRGAGKWVTILNAVGAGDVIRMYDELTYSDRTVFGGGILGMTIDGTNAGAGSTGLHVGDILQLQFDVGVQFFKDTGSIGAYLDNAYYWTEQLTGLIYARHCTSHVVFDCTGVPSSTGSFERCELSIFLDQEDPSYDGVVLRNGAFVGDGALAIRGNCNGSATPVDSAVLRLTGATPSGHYPASNSGIINSRLEIGTECTPGSYAPQTINFAAPANQVKQCYGIIDFGLNAPFAPSNAGFNFASGSFLGPIIGDPTLYRLSGLASPIKLPNQVSFGLQTSAQLLSTGDTITPRSHTPVTNYANVTGIILNTAAWDGQLCWIVNRGPGSITFAASGSHVADGSSDVIAAGTARLFMWDGATGEWYRAQ